MNRRNLLAAGVAALALSTTVLPTRAEDPIKIGLILPMTGPFTSTGKQISAAAELYNQQKGATVAGRKVEIILRDDGGVADTTKRIAQEMIVNDKVTAIAGFGLTPLAMAAAPVATQGQTPMVVMSAATSVITERSPFIVRTSQVVPQIAAPFGTWAHKQGMKKVATVVSDYGPGHDVEKWFSEAFKAAGGTVENLRVPLQNPDFSPFLQRVSDMKPDALLVFVPSGVGAQFMKQFVERGLDKSGIRLIGTGDVTDDDLLDGLGDVAIGLVTAHHYSAAHPGPVNKAFVEAFGKANKGLRPNFMAVSGYDGMHALYEGLKKTNGAGGEKLVEAMKGLAWESPRGPMSIDPVTRDIVQNVYIRKVEKVDGHLWNVEFETIPNVKDPAKAK
ncbi:MAG: ABC transporter substrate-binding protein [Siculibacillus sp.]|nr:ABC transporter substrate-binding protein [Siculibacillus sp.]